MTSTGATKTPFGHKASGFLAPNDEAVKARGDFKNLDDNLLPKSAERCPIERNDFCVIVFCPKINLLSYFIQLDYLHTLNLKIYVMNNFIGGNK